MSTLMEQKLTFGSSAPTIKSGIEPTEPTLLLPRGSHSRRVQRPDLRPATRLRATTAGSRLEVRAHGQLPPGIEFDCHAAQLLVDGAHRKGPGGEAHGWLRLACQSNHCLREFCRIARLLAAALLERRLNLRPPLVVVIQEPPAEAQRLFGQKVRSEGTGLDNGHKDTEGSELLCQGLRKAFECKFARAIKRTKLRAADAGNRREVENPSPARRSHQRQNCPGDAENTKQIGGVLVLNVAVGRLLEEPQMAVSRIVHQHGDRTKSFDGSVHGASDLLRIRYIQLH